MATVTDELLTVFKLVGAEQYKAQLGQIAGSFGQVAAQEKAATAGAAGLTGGLAGMAGKATLAAGGALVLVAAMREVVGVAESLLRPFAEAEASFVRVSLQMRNLGSVFPTKELFEFADQMRKATGFSDELIAELSVLAAQFGLTAEQIKKAVGVSLNVAAGRPGTSPNQVLETLVRASRGRKQGLISLGIDPDSIKGDIRDINVLLDTLQGRFGGQAEVSRGTLLGEFNALKDSFGELFESIGRLVGPQVAADLRIINHAVEGWTLFFQKIGAILEGLGILKPLDAGVAALGRGKGGAFKGDPEQTGYQRETAKNTEKMAGQIGSLGRFIVGGGAAASGALNFRGLNAALRAGR